MNTELKHHIQRWFRENRPELNMEDLSVVSDKAYTEVIDDIADLERGARTIFTEQYLNLNYRKSAYNFIKDVFQEYYPGEYKDYQATPIFFEINDDILVNCVSRGLLNSYNQILDDAKFYNNELRQDVSKIVNLVIL